MARASCWTGWPTDPKGREKSRPKFVAPQARFLTSLPPAAFGFRYGEGVANFCFGSADNRRYISTPSLLKLSQAGPDLADFCANLPKKFAKFW